MKSEIVSPIHTEKIKWNRKHQNVDSKAEITWKFSATMGDDQVILTNFH